jgi:dTDP-4-amino-4,6-dideoxygalactose transaminase
MTQVASEMAVPFLDLGPSHEPIKRALLAEFSALIESNAFTNGPQVAAFERAWAGYCGVDECVGLASGLDALRLGLIAAEIEPGDEVIVPALTFVATFEAVTQAGGVPVPADITPYDLNIDPDAVAAAIGVRTRFLMPVDLYGQLSDAAALRSIAEARDLAIIEDACQAHGSVRDGVRAGRIGLAAAFSFYPGKNLGAMGDAGALVTDNARLAARVRALREHGQRSKYRHELEGFTARLDTIQAIVLFEKLSRLDEWNEQRREIAAAYDSGLAGIGDLTLPPVPAGSEPTWHLYVVQTESPQALADFLATRGIGTGRHYPEAPHLSAAYAPLGYHEGNFPIAETVARRCLSLPIYPGLTEPQVEHVIDAVGEFFARG